MSCGRLHSCQEAMNLSKEYMKCQTNLQLFLYCNGQQCNEQLHVVYLLLILKFYLCPLYDSLCLLWSSPMELYSDSLHVTHSFCNRYSEYWIYHLGCVYPHAYEIVSSMSMSSSIALSSRRIMCFTLVFLSKVSSLSSWRSWLLSKGFLTFCNFFDQLVKCDGFYWTTLLQWLKVARICRVEGINEGCVREIYIHSSGLNVMHYGSNFLIQSHRIINLKLLVE